MIIINNINNNIMQDFKLKISNKYKEISEKIDVEYLDVLYSMKMINEWQFEFLLDQIGCTSRTDKQQTIYEDILQRLARKLVILDIKEAKTKSKDIKKKL